MPERKFDDFDEYASAYRETHTDNIRLSGADSFYFAEMKVRLLHGFEKDSKYKVLDVGCGDGVTEIFFKKHFPSWEVTGIDVSAESISKAKRKNIPGAVFTIYDGTKTDFPDETFDIVFMAGVLHHVNFSLHALLVEEINRVMKRKGRFYLFEHNPFNPLTRYLVNTCVFDKDAKLLKSGYTRSLLRANGLLITKRKFIIFFPRKGLLSKLIFLEKFLGWLPLGGQYFYVSEKT